MERKTKGIYKFFPTLKRAMSFQFSLYSKFESVELVKAPMFSGSGNYVWKVGGPI